MTALMTTKTLSAPRVAQLDADLFNERQRTERPSATIEDAIQAYRNLGLINRPFPTSLVEAEQDGVRIQAELDRMIPQAEA